MGSFYIKTNRTFTTIRKYAWTFTLLVAFGVNTEEEFIYDELFGELAAKNNKFKYIKVVAFSDSWQGKKGFVTDVLQELNLEGYKIYMCGPKPMINASKKVLADLKVSEKDIYYESQ